MNLCEGCRKAKAFAKKASVKKAVIKVGKTAIATCLLCGAAIGPPVSPASAEVHAPARADYAAYSVMWEFEPAHDFIVQLASQAAGNPMQPVFHPADRSDSEPPHMDGPEQTMDGSAASYSGTASATGTINGLPGLSTLPYSGGAALTFRVATPKPPNWMPIASGWDDVLGLPEHATLQFGLPMMEPARIPKAHEAPTGPRSNRNRGKRRS